MVRKLIVLCLGLIVPFSHTGCLLAKSVSHIKQLDSTQQLQLLWSMTSKSSLTFDNVSMTKNQPLIVVKRPDQLLAVEANTGKVLWQKKVPFFMNTWPVIQDDWIVLGTADANLVALDQQGNMRWKTAMTGEILQTPVLHQNTIFVQSLDGGLTAIDKEQGKVIWHYTGLRPTVSLHHLTRPIIAGNQVIAGFSNGKVMAFDKQNGQVLWEKDSSVPQGHSNFERMVDIHVDPLLIDHTVYVANYQGVLTALDEAQGTVLWEKTIAGLTKIASYQQCLYITTAQGELYALDLKTGAQKWKQKMSNTGLSSLAMYQDRLFCTDLEGRLFEVDHKSGVTLYQSRIVKNKKISISMIQDNIIYVFIANKLNAYRLPIL